jgi:hypothetical protein
MSPVATAWTCPPATYPWDLLEEEHMNDVDKLWIALGKAIRAGASEKQINGIARSLNSLRRNN